MRISANTSVKTIEGHYTCHTKSVITKPQNVLVLRDIMCSGYVAGGNTKFFGHAQMKQAGRKSPLATDIQQAITDRLSFVDDASGEYESMLAFIVPYGHGDRRDQVYSLSARLLPWEVTRGESSWHDYFPGGKPGYNHYAGMLGLEQVHFGEDIRAAENMEFISQGSVNNALCFLGPHRVFSPWSQTFYELTYAPERVPLISLPAHCTLSLARVPAPNLTPLHPRCCSQARPGPLRPRRPARGTCHAHPNTLLVSLLLRRVGFLADAQRPLVVSLWQDARWRRGESVSLDAARNSMVGLEAAAHSQMVFTRHN